MSSDNASSAISYMSISSYSDGPSWGIPFMNAGKFPEMDPYEEVAQQGQATPLSPAYVPESIIYQRSGGRSEEDPIDYAADTDDNGEDKEEEESSDDEEEEEEHLAPTIALSSVDPVPSAEETDPFKTDESAATPPPQPPAYRTTSRMSVRRKRADIPEAELPPQKRLLLTAPIPRFEIGESSTTVAARHPRYTGLRGVECPSSLNRSDDHIMALEAYDTMEAGARVITMEDTVVVPSLPFFIS
ncbi:hypothetical protein Tco_0830657 [Tanacetum coccineum]